ncbi:MAG TPA: hypothetical protein VGC92_01390 [Phenylobacterium sp.]|jgi:hypothetical protein
MSRTLKVMVFEPGKDGEVREIPDTLTALQQIVGGYIENVYVHPNLTHVMGRCTDERIVVAVSPAKKGLVWIVNEEGLLKGLPPNRWVKDAAGNELALLGPILLARYTASGDNANLLPADVAAFKDW